MFKVLRNLRLRNSEIKKLNLEKQNEAAYLQAKFNAMPSSQAFIESKNYLSDHTVIFCAKRGVLVSPKNLEESESVVSFLANGVSGLVDKTLLNPVRNFKASVVSAFKSSSKQNVSTSFPRSVVYTTSAFVDPSSTGKVDPFLSSRMNNFLG